MKNIWLLKEELHLLGPYAEPFIHSKDCLDLSEKSKFKISGKINFLKCKYLNIFLFK